MRSICFVGRDSYPVLNPAIKTARIGGESVQQTLLAREFVRLGYRVSMIVIDHGQPDGEVIDGIQVFKTYDPGIGLPGVRFFHPRGTGVLKALRRAGADVYYQSCAGTLTGLVAWHCRRNKGRFVFRVASDADCIPGKELISMWRDRKLYDYGLKRADLILTQSQKQTELLKHHHGLESTCVNMVVDTSGTNAETPRDIDVLWVSNFFPLKRPQLVIELAQRLPNCRFTMIGGPRPRLVDCYNETEAKAGALDNLDFVGPVPYNRIAHYFARANLFLSTSETEGFPNTFLQSWIHGVPVVSFFDPDNIIEREGLGRSPGTLEEMVKTVDDLISDDEKRRHLSQRARAFALQRYSPQSVSTEMIEAFSKAFS